MSGPAALLVCFGVYWIIAYLFDSVLVGLVVAALAFYDLSRERGDSASQDHQAKKQDDEPDPDYKPWRIQD